MTDEEDEMVRAKNKAMTDLSQHPTVLGVKLEIVDGCYVGTFGRVRVRIVPLATWTPRIGCGDVWFDGQPGTLDDAVFYVSTFLRGLGLKERTR
jgi:hypothetical protein